MDFLGQRKMAISLDGRPLPTPQQSNPTRKFHQVHALTIGETNENKHAVTLDQRQHTPRKSPNKHTDDKTAEDRLFRHIPRKNPFSRDAEWKLCVSESRQRNVLGEVHDASTAVHLGLAKCLRRAREKCYRPRRYRDRLRHVQTFTTCALFTPEQRKPADLMTTMQCGKTWEIVCANFVGPLPRSAQLRSSPLIIIDKLTRWLGLVSVRKAIASSVLSAFTKRVPDRFGCHEVFLLENGKQFTSKNGKQFTSKEVNQLLRKHGVTISLTTPYTPPKNPTGRTNRVNKALISKQLHRQIPQQSRPALQLPKLWEKGKHSAEACLIIPIPVGKIQRNYQPPADHLSTVITVTTTSKYTAIRSCNSAPNAVEAEVTGIRPISELKSKATPPPPQGKNHNAHCTAYRASKVASNYRRHTGALTNNKNQTKPSRQPHRNQKHRQPNHPPAAPSLSLNRHLQRPMKRSKALSSASSATSNQGTRGQCLKMAYAYGSY